MTLVSFIGFMGAGKTSTAYFVARRLDLLFVDSDQLIEERAGKSTADIFAEYGEETFRQWEREVISDVIRDGDVCLATGGGAFIDPDTRELLLKHGHVIFLDAPFDRLWDRIKGDPARPLLHGDDAEQRMRHLYEQRRPIYKQAPIVVDAMRPVHEVAADVVHLIKAR